MIETTRREIVNHAPGYFIEDVNTKKRTASYTFSVMDYNNGNRFKDVTETVNLYDYERLIASYGEAGNMTAALLIRKEYGDHDNDGPRFLIDRHGWTQYLI